MFAPTPNPLLGVLFHWIGGLAAASFYLPYKRVRRWSWETYWLVGGLFSWIIAPPLLAALLVPNFWHVITSAPPATLFWTLFFGLLWGVGGLTFGLTVRYLGLALGYAIALGCCAAFGTLIPPLFTGTFGQVLHSNGGRITLGGIAVCLVGIAISGLAGKSKESEMSIEQKTAAVKEFNFPKGLIIAILCGIMSACMAFAFAAGAPIGAAATEELARNGRLDVWKSLPTLVVILWGGFATNCIWCIALNIRNKSAREYLTLSNPANEVAAPANTGRRSATPLLSNYLFSALAGVIWYFQFFFYSMGETKMGEYAFSSWTLHMASIIIFSTLWGVALHEWKGSSKRTHALITAGLLTLVASTLIVGYGNYRDAQEKSQPTLQSTNSDGRSPQPGRKP